MNVERKHKNKKSGFQKRVSYAKVCDLKFEFLKEVMLIFLICFFVMAIAYGNTFKIKLHNSKIKNHFQS
jgi:hypothetical protein